MGAIDADAHVIETMQTWAYLDEDKARFAPRLLSQTGGEVSRSNEGLVLRDFWVIEDRAHGKDRNVGTNTSQESREMLSVEARLAHMDSLEIEVQVLYPTLFLRPVVREPDREVALCKTYNRWLAEIWRQGGGRLRWVAMPPLLMLEKAPRLIRDELAWAKDHGAVGVFMRGLECERNLADSYFDPLWDMAQELDLPICIHSANGSFLHHDFFLKDTSFTRFKLAVVGAFHSLIEKEVPKRYPNLRWGFVEVGAQWLPYVLSDLRERFRKQGKAWSPTIMADHRMWVACENWEDLSYIFSYAGEDQLMIGTDYGHHDPSTELNAVRRLREDGRLAPHLAKKILESNPRRFYGLP